MRVALVHDYLNQMGGAEKVLLALHDLFPQAPIYTSIYDPRHVDPRFRKMDIRTSFMQRVPFVRRHHQPFLPLYPYAFERFDLREYDLVVSDSSAFAKGVVTRPEALHICYCHTPMRWAWSYEDYVERERLGTAARTMLPAFITWLRSWDFATAARVDYFIANSPSVAARIAKYYRRDCVEVPPPIDTTRFQVANEREDTYLIVSRLVPYKRIDLAVRAFTILGLPLTIIGDGRDAARLRRLAGKNVRFLGHQSDEQVRYHMARCKAFIFPGEEDFGMAPVEAQACGRPVIAYGAGGALASVVEGLTGEFFYEPTAEALADVVSHFDPDAYDPLAIRRHAEDFDTTVFLRRISQFIESKIESHPVLARKAGLEYTGPGVPHLTERRRIRTENGAAEYPTQQSRPRHRAQSMPRG
jgi:glycosyltransferase involved in cell wall biosynthesis